MYKWNKKDLLTIISKLENLKTNDKEEQKEIDNSISQLTNLIKKQNNNDNNIINENYEYKELLEYTNIMDKIIEKYLYIKIKPNTSISYHKFKKIFKPKKELINITEEIINNINPKWYNLLSPIFKDKQILDFKRNNDNSIYYISYFNKILISLNKQNNIEDYLSPIHEFLHALTIIKNDNYLNNIECEFLSILGELILSHEMKNNNIYTKEFIKANTNDFAYIIDSIHSIIFRRLALTESEIENEKIKYLNEELDIPIDIIKEMYDTSLTYNYSTIISYFIAIELFEIYKKDKEKCVYICEYLIENNDTLENKLTKNNIIILQNDSKYKKTLKKEYAKYNQ